MNQRGNFDSCGSIDRTSARHGPTDDRNTSLLHVVLVDKFNSNRATPLDGDPHCVWSIKVTYLHVDISFRSFVILRCSIPLKWSFMIFLKGTTKTLALTLYHTTTTMFVAVRNFHGGRHARTTRQKQGDFVRCVGFADWAGLLAL